MKEDWCSTYYTRKDHKWQTDLWWWFRTAIIVNPPRGLKVNTNPLERST